MKRYFKYFRLLVVVILLCSFGLSLNTTNIEAFDTNLYERLNTGQDASSDPIYGGNCVAMQFKTDATTQNLTTAVAHTVTKVQLYLQRSGTPGDIIVSLRKASGGLPSTTTDLATGTYDGDDLTLTYNWCEIELTFVSSSNSIEADTDYALVLKAPSGTAANYVEWGVDAGGGLANAESSHSVDGGISWTTDAPEDALFQVFGTTALKVIGANVFQNYLVTGDLLIGIEAFNVYPPYVNTSNASNCFQVQLIGLDTTTVLAAVPMTAWGYRPESIYLSPSSASALTGGGAYIIRIKGLIGATPPSDDYTLIGSSSTQPSDWKGTNLDYLDDWIIEVGYRIQDYEGTGINSIVTGTTDGGEILTDIGGAIFTNGISGIAQERPDVFMVPKSKPLFPTTTNAATYDSSKNYQLLLGTPIANDLDTWGSLFSISGQNFGGWLIGLLVAVVVLAGLILGGRAAIPIFVISGVPLMFIGNYVGVLGIQWTLIIAFIFLAIFAWWFWPKG